MRIAYYRCAAKKNVHALPFSEAVSMVSYGDDNVINFSERVAHYFDQVEVTEAYSSFGMVYTDEAKTGEIVRCRKLEDVAYLKRGFRKDGPVYRAPMSLVTIMETPYWIRKCPDHDLATKMNVECSIMELAQHDRETFDRLSQQIIGCYYEKTGTYPEVMSYDVYQEEWNREMGLLV
jgi:hypothetical protein